MLETKVGCRTPKRSLCALCIFVVTDVLPSSEARMLKSVDFVLEQSFSESLRDTRKHLREMGTIQVWSAEDASKALQRSLQVRGL